MLENNLPTYHQHLQVKALGTADPVIPKAPPQKVFWKACPMAAVVGRELTPLGLASGMTTYPRVGQALAGFAAPPATATAPPRPVPPVGAVVPAAKAARAWVSIWKVSGVVAEFSCQRILQ